MPVLLIGAGILLILGGLGGLRRWYLFWSVGRPADDFSLYMGIGASVLGAAFIAFAVVDWRRF